MNKIQTDQVHKTPEISQTKIFDCLLETVQMWGHNIVFHAELTKIIPN